MMYKLLVKPVLFSMDAERAHRFVFRFLKILFAIPGVRFIVCRFFSVRNPSLFRRVFNLTFSNPVGLAAGFDKDGKYIDCLSPFGFGFIETGTITPLPQPGNEKPRLFRLPDDEALINRMGFNNEGAESAAKRLRNRNQNTIIGGNIGKNKNTLNEKAVDDYVYCFKTLFNRVDYFVINVSSPNTPGLRELQDKDSLFKIIDAVQQVNFTMAQPKPVLLKISPDLSFGQLDEIIQIIIKTKISGVIAANTTIDRDNLSTDKKSVMKAGEGGLSGRPLRKRSTEMVRYIAEKSNKSFAIIASGGIHSAADAVEKLKAGADLVQIYTGFVYEGPSLVRKINRALLNSENSVH